MEPLGAYRAFNARSPLFWTVAGPVPFLDRVRFGLLILERQAAERSGASSGVRPQYVPVDSWTTKINEGMILRVWVTEWMDTYQLRKSNADAYLTAQRQALSSYFKCSADQIEIAEIDLDQKRATDFVTPNGQRVAARVRTPQQIRYADQFTVRATKGRDGLNEWEKYQRGYVSYMLYAFGDGESRLTKWTLLDVRTIVEIAKAKEPPSELPFDGGSMFVFDLSDYAAAVVARSETAELMSRWEALVTESDQERSRNAWLAVLR